MGRSSQGPGAGQGIRHSLDLIGALGTPLYGSLGPASFLAHTFSERSLAQPTSPHLLTWILLLARVCPRQLTGILARVSPRQRHVEGNHRVERGVGRCPSVAAAAAPIAAVAVVAYVVTCRRRCTRCAIAAVRIIPGGGFAAAAAAAPPIVTPTVIPVPSSHRAGVSVNVQHPQRCPRTPEHRCGRGHRDSQPCLNCMCVDAGVDECVINISFGTGKNGMGCKPLYLHQF